MIRAAVIALMILLPGFASGVSAAPTVLMRLEHEEAGKAVQQKVELKEGLVESKSKGTPRDKWVIRAGDAIASDTRPGDRAAGFYQLGLGESTPLFVVNVRYFQDTDGGKWVPHFQLIEEPLMKRGPDGKWQPLTVIQGVPTLIMQTGTALPNAEGYTATLEFGLTTGGMAIDAWLVQ